MLVDNITIQIKAGDGGNGSVHFKRNAQTARGGPDGGSGGNGGNIYFRGVNDISALRQFRYKKTLRAENGVNGSRQNMFGRNGEDLIVIVPIGTQITEKQTGKTYEIIDITSQILLAKGGVGGRGNNEFKTSTNQAPRFAEKGTPGQEKELFLKLRLIADIGLIGLPNAGKSSLLTVLTNAQPKIGNYPFTTLEPNLGVMHEVVLADIPGLIEGASHGKGLGIQFLQHIEKTKILAHCIASDNEQMFETYTLVRKELGTYNTELLSKPEIILFTKSDLLDKKTLDKKISEFKKLQKQTTILPVSVYDKETLQKLKARLQEMLK